MQRCPSCNEENPDRFRMCGFCGTPLAAAPPPEESRKTVTIVFCDLKGSTSLGERLDSEALREVLAVYFASMRAVLERHGGTVEKYIGDAIMAVFGLPRMHEDDALRAVRAAFEMQEALREVNTRLHATWGVTLQNRTGVNTGEVVAGDASTGQRLATGDTVNVAARLEQAAPEGEVLLGESTYRLVRDAAEVRPVAPLDLKGKSEPVPAYQLLGVSGYGEAIRRRVDLPMVGRDAELAAVLEAFASAVAGRRCELLTVVAQAGVGKSRLLEEVVREVGDRARVLRGRCPSYGDGATFLPLIDVVRQCAGIAADDDDEGARAKLRAVARADVADRLASVMALGEASYGKDELLWAARALFDGLAEERPLVVVFEDIHWAEPTFLDLVEHVADASTGVPLFVVCAARHELFEDRPGWCEGMPNARRVELAELSAQDSAVVVQNLLGGPGLPQALAQRITEVAGGNPLYVEQTLSMLVDEGVLRDEGTGPVVVGAPEAIAIPDTISALLASRLDRLGAPELGVLTRASVIGLEFGDVDLVALAPPDEASGVIPGALSTLGAKRLVRAQRARGEEHPVAGLDGSCASYEFAHILVRNVAYDRLLKRSRAALHERFADWLTERAGTRVAELEEIVGYHVEQAYRNLAELGPLNDAGRAVGSRASAHLASAGRRARARGDMPAAANLLQRAAALVEPDDVTRAGLLLVAGEALTETGELEAAGRALNDARDTALLLGDPKLARTARLAMMYLRYTTDPQHVGEDVLGQVEAMMPELEMDADHEGQARAWRLLAYVHWTASRSQAGAEAAERAMEHAGAAGDEVLARSFLGSLAGVALFGPTPVEEAIAICKAVLGRAQDDRKASAIVEAALGHLEAMRGDAGRARELYRHSRAVLEEFGWRLCAALTSLDSAEIEVLAGDLAAAERELDKDYRALEAMGEHNYIATTAAMLADVLFQRGDHEGAARFSEESREVASADDVPSQFLWRCVQAKLAATRGAHDQAERLSTEALAIIDGSDLVDWQGKGRMERAEVLALRGDDVGARASLEEAAELFGRKGDVVMAGRARHAADALGAAAAAPGRRVPSAGW